MIKPDRPANEAERLAALQRHRILDTPREQEFEDLVTIARAIAKRPDLLLWPWLLITASRLCRCIASRSQSDLRTPRAFAW